MEHTEYIYEALEIPVVKDGDLKLPVDELYIRSYDVRQRYGTDWVTEYNYVSKEELTNLPLDKQIELMEQRGSIKKPSPVRNFISDLYRKVGEKFGLLEKNRNYNFYTDID